MSEKYLGKYITIDNLSNSKAEIIPVGNTEQNVIEEVKGNTVIGTNIVVNDVESTAAKIRLIGDIQQEVRDGKNLFNINDRLVITNGVTIDSDGWITITGDNTNGTETKFYNFFTNVSNLLKTSTNYNIITEIKKVTGTGYIAHVSHNATSYNSQFTEMKEYSFVNLTSNSIKTDIAKTKSDFSSSQSMLRSFIGFEVGKSGSITFRLSVLEDTTVTADTFKYEAYGKTPTPDFPSEIKTVTGNVEVSIDNGNMFDFQKWVDNGFSINTGTKEIIDNGIKITATSGDTFTMTYGMDTTGGSNADKINKYGFKIQSSSTYRITADVVNNVSRSVYAFFYDKDKKYIKHTSNASHSKGLATLKFTTPENAEYVCFRFGISTNGATEIFSNIRLNRGETDLGYVEHQSQVKTISLGDIRVYEDEKIYGINDKKYHNEKWERLYITSSSNVVQKTTVNGNSRFIIGTSGKAFNSKDNNTLNKIYSNVALADTGHNLYMENNGVAYNNSGNQILMYLEETKNMTADEFKAYCEEKGVYVDYMLATPTDTEITDTTLIAQLNAIKEASAYEGTTVIMSTGDVLPINVEFTYNHVVPSPSLEIPSRVKSVGDNINLCNSPYTVDNKYTFTAERDDHYLHIGYYASMQAGKTYRVSFESDGEYGITPGTDTVQIFLIANGSIYTTNIYSKDEKITPTVSGDYYIRVDINQKGKTHSFWNFKISEYSETKSVYSPEGMGAIKHVVSNKNLAYDVEYKNPNIQYYPAVNASYRLSKDSYYLVSFDTVNTGQLLYINQGINYGIKRISEYHIVADGTRKYWIIQALNSNEYKNSALINKSNTGSANTGYTYNFMIEKIPATSDKEALTYLPTEYVENKKQEYIIPTQKPFRAIGDYKDTFINIEGKWYENHVIGKYIIDGTEAFSGPYAQENGFFRCGISASNMKEPASAKYESKLGYCNKYMYLENFNKPIEHIYCEKNKSIYVFSESASIESFKAQLGTDTYVVYPLAEPELIPCTPQQENILKQLQNIYMYSGTNNFYGESFIEPQINLTVKKSVEDYDMYITADGYLHIPELNKRYLVDLYESNIPIMPEAVESSVRVAGRDGDIGLNTTYEPIPFNIVCYTEDDLSLLEKVNEEKAMNKFLNKIKNKKIKLAFEKYDSYYEVKYNLALVTSNYPKHLKFSIPLKSSDSYGKDLIKKIIIGSASKESKTLENVGAIFTIYGPAISPIISLNDYSIEYNSSILSGARVEIDTNKSTVTYINADGVKTNVMKYYNHQFPKIENGNNELKVLSGIENGGNVIVEWNDLKL